MSDPGREASDNTQAIAAAEAFGRAVVGRDLTADEVDALGIIFKSAAGALRHGFIRRLAEHVQEERETENVEEFFEGVITDE